MKFLIILIMAVCCFLTSCEKSKSSETLKVTVTVFSEYDWAKNIVAGADSIEIFLLQKQGLDMHSYKPSAKDIATIAESDMVVYVGGESDGWVKKALAATPKKNRIEINLLESLGEFAKTEGGIEIHENHEEHEEHEEHHHSEFDEHVWLSIKNAKFFVKNLTQELVKLSPKNQEIFYKNSNTYWQQLDSLENQFNDLPKKSAVVFGDRFPFRYLMEDLDLKYYAAFEGCSSESEASFETITFLANKLDSLNLPGILTIEGSDQKVAKAILKVSQNSKDAPIYTLNSMQSVCEKDYLTVMKENLEVLKKVMP